MSLSPDFIANVIFGVIMTIIGLAALWAVRWQVFLLLRHQRHLDDEERSLRLRRANSDVSSDDSIIPAPCTEHVMQGQSPLTRASAHINRSDTDLSTVSASFSDYLRLPY